MKRNLLIFFSLITSLLVLWIFLQWKNIVAFPSIISSFYSKEFCSCYFVMNQSEEQCHNFARQWVPISDFTLNKEKKEVFVSGLGRTTKSIFISEMYGCRIQGESE